MPPEYLTKEAADKKFRELEDGFRTAIEEQKDGLHAMELKNVDRDAKVENAFGAIGRIETMLKDRGQMWMTVALFVLTNIVTVGVALYASAPKGVTP